MHQGCGFYLARQGPIVYTESMSPTVFRIGNYRFYFFSREEEKTHVHVISPEGEAKFWIEPIVSYGFGIVRARWKPVIPLRCQGGA